MYQPKNNHILVEINDKEAAWGSSEGDKFSVAYREGTVIDWNVTTPVIAANMVHEFTDVQEISDYLSTLNGKSVMWNEGHEAGTVFEHEGKKYALIYWWDIIGIKE